MGGGAAWRRQEGGSHCPERALGTWKSKKKSHWVCGLQGGLGTIPTGHCKDMRLPVPPT